MGWRDEWTGKITWILVGFLFILIGAIIKSVYFIVPGMFFFILGALADGCD